MGVDAHWYSQSNFLRIAAEEKSVETFVQRACGGALFIEDVGSAIADGWNLAYLSDFFGSLYARGGRPMVWITSNYSLNELKKKLYDRKWSGLDITGSAALVDRINALCVEIHNTGANMRQGAG